jgi:gluconate 2-dehydrogenase gamma chain
VPSYSTDRRGLLKIIGAIGATCSYPYAGDELFAQAMPQAHIHSEPPVANHGFFNEVDFKTLSVIAELIIPQTDTPGAIAAGVPAYIDQAVARNADFQLLVSDGLRWLDVEAANMIAGRNFVELTESQQLTILQPLCDAYDTKTGRYARNVQFFSLLKNLVADGYYTSQVGLVQELGYRSEMLTEYPNCST